MVSNKFLLDAHAQTRKGTSLKEIHNSMRKETNKGAFLLGLFLAMAFMGNAQDLTQTVKGKVTDILNAD